MQHNTLPWQETNNDAWLASVVVAFDATMCQVADGAEVAGAADVIDLEDTLSD